ncbi:hypothetical protein [Streptomyces sp. URMC 123]|uniref:hypothetical protein n=1 Tax=Streptomyces sp. URMC 123 TaxID=3423403 RepID=UPI003F1ACAD3
MPRVQRPGGKVRWAGSAEEYAGLAAAAGPDLVPCLLPSSPAKRRLWREVLDGRDEPVAVAPATAPSADGAPVPAPPAGDAPAAAGCAVIGWGGPARTAASVYAAVSGASLTLRSDLDGVVDALARCGEPHAVVIAPAADLTVAALVRLSAAAADAGTSVGFLCGRDEAALSYAVAKALLRPGGELSGVDVFDAPSHRQEENAGEPAAELGARLRRPALVKVLRSHGEGGHAKLPGVVVCGLLDETEFPEVPAHGCRRDERVCKRAEPMGADTVFGDELGGHVTFFLCCNGFNVAGELYPSPVSMALALAEGRSGAVVAPVRPLIVPDEMLEELLACLAEGGALGAVVARLNALSARIGQPHAFVLHGDPRTVVAARAAGAPRPAADGDGGTHRSDASDTSNGPDRSDGPDGSEEAEAARRRAEVQDWLVELLARAERGRRLLRSARAWLGERGAPLTEPLVERFERLERSALNSLKWVEKSPEGEPLRRLLRTTALLRLAVPAWDRAVGRLALDARETLDAFDLGHYDQAPLGILAGGPCGRCGTPVELHRFGRGEPADALRVAELCLVCGPLAEYRAGGLALAAESYPRTGRPGGGDFRLRVRLTAPDTAVAGTVQLYLRFFDKANGVCVHEEERAVPARDQLVDFSFPLPHDLGVDLHSVRLVAASAFDLAYLRVRFVGLPDGLPDGLSDELPGGPGAAGPAEVTAR